MLYKGPIIIVFSLPVNVMDKATTSKNGPDSCAVSALKPNLKGDWPNFFLLLLLYTIQGLPLGISAALPLIFQSKKAVTYKDQVNQNLERKQIIFLFYFRISSTVT